MLSCGLVRLSLWCGLEWSLGEVGAQTRVHHTWMGSGPQGDMQRFMNPDAYKEGREIWTGKQVCALPSGAYSHPLLVSAHICMGCLSSVSSVLSRVQLFATHGLQDARPRCPSPTPGVYSNSCPLSRWCHPTISSSHLIISSLLLPLSIFLIIRVFSNELVLCIRWPKYWSFSFNMSPFNEYSGLISFRMDWLDLLEVQGTLKSLLQQHSSKASILWCSAFFIVHLLHPYMTTGKTMAEKWKQLTCWRSPQ